MPPASSSSSEDEDFAKFASIAVAGTDIYNGAQESQKANHRKAVKAALRRAGGGGVKGAGGDNTDSDGGGMLDAGQLRVADMLKKRLDDEIDVEDASQSVSVLSEGDKNESESDDSGGVQLFKNGPAAAILTKKQQDALPIPKRPLPRNCTLSSSSSDEDRIGERYLSTAVDSTSLVDGANRAAAAAKKHLAPVNHLNADEGGKASKRKRRKEKEAAAAARIINRAAKRASVDGNGATQSKKKKKKKATEGVTPV